ncbi:cytochrome d ubiquinol oxidase subunit II [Pelistega europaea]|uniref:Cytochrome d ubiquinol oxidase subunit II n=1 Tax=Pelistega europaea TaxID=106147 RepID=A0A7Y4P690_9BURK|nr:cytochrome d ubiquinol oxidase subunit II [Pelistega europaea]NOL49679.1 cytochrome d ubiquinol oxidase subunit II [Pelistega europaea]
MDWNYWLPLIFLALLGLAMFIYVTLDGFDLGVGMLMPRAKSAEQDIMVGSIGPFWDANETWIVLGAGVLFIAFPKANTLILGELYLPATFMIFMLLIRGAAFDFRAKADDYHKELWNIGFMISSGGMALCQGWMLGRYITAFGTEWDHYLFTIGVMLSVPAVYVLLAACWLIAKTEGELQRKAKHWANQAWWLVVVCLALISLATPYISQGIYNRWFSEELWLLPIPIATALLLLRLKFLVKGEEVLHHGVWRPFRLTVFVLVLCALGLAISVFPYAVIDKLTVWEAAASTPTLVVTLIGVCITVPIILAYSIFAYWVFRGKASTLKYE